ncbi:hypothetical protein HYH03_005089 [Edaphochlamys debaryana]|uniref:Uncharacterized protein n=1 Tax=Edaphochlamys debaryana TaxID=47281 RepID=A0A835Y9G5_9CHLO|nr:hypothetical protein HYH03_005089 [Edaphochlamys debaryana]|eukprot:KAG2496671.1 hypothetical protein HYH03_005089 [Edaphochlamys debaryana]
MQYYDDEFQYDDDMDYMPPARKKMGYGGKEKPGGGGGAPKRPPAHSPPPGAGGMATSPSKAVRSRPTNNQLLYKAYFRWPHYPHKLKNANLPVETDACASVTAAFLQVLQIMQTAEQIRIGGNKRNVLQILSSNTRRTKVVELSSGTHRVPDELKKHYLSDGEGGQYSTNLDRNRYGNDDNYLFTVIRYDLEFLGLCPCMVDVEIIDAKQGNASIIVSAGPEVCTCQGGPQGPTMGGGPMGSGGAGAVAGGGGHSHHQVAVGAASGLPAGHHLAPAGPTLSGGHGGVIKGEFGLGAPAGPIPGNGAYPPAALAAVVAPPVPDVGVGVAPLFGGGGAFRPSPALAGPIGRESPKRSGTSVSQLFDALVMAATGGAEGAAAAGGMGGEPPVTSAAHADRPADRPAAGGVQRLHPPPNRNKSKLWSLGNLSFGGEVDSLQNALDAFREQDEIASGDPAAFLTGGNSGAGGEGALVRQDSLRQRRRKPVRNSSILGRPASSSGMAPVGSKLGISLREKSDDNLKLAADPDLGLALAGAQVSSLVSGEDDNDGGAADADGDEALAAKGEDLGAEGEGEAGGEEGGDAVGTGGGGGLARTASGVRPSALGRHHVRHVPRQSSVANLAPRVANAGAAGLAGAAPGAAPMGGSASAAIAGEQLRRLANELEVMKAENRSLRQQLHRANSTSAMPGTSGSGGGAGAGGTNAAAPAANNGSGSPGPKPATPFDPKDDSARLRKLESELSSLKGELLGLNGAKKTAEDENSQLRRELLASQQQVAALLSRILGGAAPGLPGAAPAAAGVAGLLGAAGPGAGAFDAAAFGFGATAQLPTADGAEAAGRKRTAEEAGLVAEDAGRSAPAAALLPSEPSLAAMPTLTANLASAPSADPNAAPTPADSHGLSEMASLLTLPVLDAGGGFTASELAAAVGGAGGGTPSVAGGVTGLAATSGVAVAAAGSGSASVPQMPGQRLPSLFAAQQ